MRIPRMNSQLRIFLFAAGLISILLGLAYTYVFPGPMLRPGVAVQSSQEIPPGIYCLDVNMDGRADLVVFASQPLRVLAQDSVGLGQCIVYGQPDLAIQARGWVIDARGAIVVVPMIRTGEDGP